jgi:hypothetical protein
MDNIEENTTHVSTVPKIDKPKVKKRINFILRKYHLKPSYGTILKLNRKVRIENKTLRQNLNLS